MALVLSATFAATGNAGTPLSADSASLLGEEDQRDTNIGTNERSQSDFVIAKSDVLLKDDSIAKKNNASKQQDNSSLQLTESGTAIKTQFYERCSTGTEKLYYDCECLANEYVKQKTADPKLSDYKFVQGTAYKQCFDAKATAKTETLACKNTGLPMFDCDCNGKTYAVMLAKAGIPLPGSRKAKDLKAKALSACMVGF